MNFDFNINPIWFKIGAIILITGGVALAAGVAAYTRGSLPRQLYDQYTGKLDKELRSLFIRQDAGQIAKLQMAAIVAIMSAAAFTGRATLLIGIAVVAYAPKLWLERRRVETTNQIEEQLAHWLSLLANALRASPSIPAAIEASVKLVPVPIQNHVELVLREIKLGQPAEIALRNMGQRVESYTVKNALATIMIGQRTGGNVPHLLEESASGLREMARLESLIRAKTAEGKGQMMVLSVIPLGLIFVLESMKEGWFDPFYNNGPKGWFLLGGAAALWGLSIFISTRILDIEV